MSPSTRVRRRPRVTVWHGRDAVLAEVVDDGVGGAVLAGGSGLGGVAERLEALSGRLGLDSPPGAGTRVRAVVPVSEASAVRNGGSR